MSLTPRFPIRSDHRLISKMISSGLGGKVEIIPREVDMVARLFIRDGGSWVSLYKGSPEELTRLKKILKFMAAKKFLTPKQKWE